MQKITSRENQKLKFARKVRDGKEKDAIFVEGVRLAKELLRSDLEIFECFISESFNKNNQILLEETSKLFNKISEIPDQIFNSLSDTTNSQGIILIAEKPKTGEDQINKLFTPDFTNFPFLLMLHQLNNPLNLGAILRTCEAVGISGVILSENSADVFSPKSLRSAMGAAFRLKFWTNANFDRVLEWAEEKQLRTVCADVNSKNSFWNFNWLKPTLLIFGSEAHGLSEKEREKVDEGVYIPMENDVESLNLAVSAGIILFEAKRNWSK